MANTPERASGGHDDRKSIYEQLAGRQSPNAPNAWRIGSALYTCGVEWSSGLLALYAADRLRDVVGILGSIRPGDLRPHVEDVIVLVRTAAIATYTSPFEDHRLVDEDEEDDSPEARDMLARRELRILAQRHVARHLWQIDPNLRELLEDARGRWFRGQHLSTLPNMLASAYVATARASRSRSTFGGREAHVRNTLTRWLYTEIHPEPPDFSEVFLLAMLKSEPTSRAAELARLLLASEYFAHNLEIAERWPSGFVEGTLRSSERAQYHIEDPLWWLPRDGYDGINQEHAEAYTPSPESDAGA